MRRLVSSTNMFLCLFPVIALFGACIYLYVVGCSLQNPLPAPVILRRSRETRVDRTTSENTNHVRRCMWHQLLVSE